MSAVIEYNNQKYKEWYNKFPYILNSPIVTCKIEGDWVINCFKFLMLYV